MTDEQMRELVEEYFKHHGLDNKTSLCKNCKNLLFDEIGFDFCIAGKQERKKYLGFYPDKKCKFFEKGTYQVNVTKIKRNREDIDGIEPYT